jgi:hypothetical protein
MHRLLDDELGRLRDEMEVLQIDQLTLDCLNLDHGN